MSRVCRDSHPRLHLYTFLVFYQIEAKLWKSSDTICIIQTHTYRPDCYYVISLRQQADKLNSHCWLSILDKPYNQITLYVTSRPGKKSLRILISSKSGLRERQNRSGKGDCVGGKVDVGCVRTDPALGIKGRYLPLYEVADNSHGTRWHHALTAPFF